MLKKIICFLLLLVLGALLTTSQVLGHDDEVPPGFQKSVVATGLNYPDAVAQAPDGRVFVLEKTGSIRIVKNNTLLSTPMLTLPVDTDQEHGLLGIAFDSAFSSNNYIYLFYVNNSPNELRISRFTTSGDSASIASEKILLRSTQPLNPYHIGGTVRVGPDGKLWISVGNNSVNSNSQDLSNIFGKILRINTDGSIPSDNPFFGLSGREGSIWAYGFRNPYRFSFIGSKPIVGDVGEATSEEVNIVVKSGNYGWPQCEGKCSDSSFVNPIFTYSHGGSSAAIVGGFIYKGSSFPASYKDGYFYADYTRSFIRFLDTDENGNFVDDNEFDHHADIVVDLTQGSDGSIYYVSFADQTFGPGTGTLYKISYNPTNLAPHAEASADPIAGQAPLKVEFSSKGSSDPADLPLTYSWDFGDSTSSTEANPTHTYTQNGTYTAKLTVNNGTKTHQAQVKIIVGRDIPQATIIEPALETSYNAGQKIQFSGSASDSEDGDLPASAFSWSVLFHHQTHTHPFINEIKGVKSGDFTIPDTGEESHEVRYEIILTVKNSAGITKTVSRTIYPNVVNLSFTTSPLQDLTVNINGIPHEAPFVLKSVVGFKHVLSVPNLQTRDGFNYTFSSWSDNGNQTHTITSPAVDTSYSAQFNKSGSGNGHIHFRVREIDSATGNWTGGFINGATAKLTDSAGSVVYETQTSKTIDNQEGWVYFDNIPAGVYGVLSYKQDKVGGWRQTTCQGAGTSQNASISNNNTGNFKAAWQSNVSVTANQITWCVDEGLKSAESGELALRVALIEDDPFQPGKYISLQHINGATVKLTNTAGTIVSQTEISADNPIGEDGWVKFKNIPAGTYGIMAYKPGFSGFWKMINCAGEHETNAVIQNSSSENYKAAWNNNVTIVGGVTTYCHDLGLRGYGHLHFRVREIDASGKWTGKFINGATAKLTDKTGTTVYQTETSKTINNEEGWVYFDNIQAGFYGSLAYKDANTGAWRQTDCESGGTTENVTIQNTNTEDKVAAWQGNLHVPASKVLWCSDLGLTNSNAAQTGHVHIRIREIDQSGQWTGNFVNGVTAKLTDPTGATVIQTQTSKTINGADGWVYFDFVPAGNYGILSYKEGSRGAWRQTNCDTGSSTADASIENANTEGQVAAWQSEVVIVANQVTWCKDEGLKAVESIPAALKAAPTATPSADLSGTPEPTNTPTPTIVPTVEVTPTPTSSPSPTDAPTPTPSDSPIPTSTPAPTETPVPTPSEANPTPDIDN